MAHSDDHSHSWEPSIETSSSASHDSSRARRRRRAVSFAETSQVTLVLRSTQEEIDALWYSRDEKADLKRAFAACVGEVAIKRIATPVSEFPLEELYECIGMESRMSIDLMEETNTHKRVHVRTIIAAQARQEVMNIRDEEELVRLSRKSSWLTCEKARRAARYWQAR